MNKTKLNSYVIHFAGEAAVEAEDIDMAMVEFGELNEYDDFQIVQIDQL